MNFPTIFNLNGNWEKEKVFKSRKMEKGKSFGEKREEGKRRIKFGVDILRGEGME